jgi:hypothetical protein
MKESSEVSVALKPLEKVKRVYSGQPGCACGCRGTYWPLKTDGAASDSDKKQIRRIYNLFKKNSAKIYTYRDCRNRFVCYDASDRRTYTMYYII